MGNTTIDKSKLEEYLANGWTKGKLSSCKENNRICVNKDGINSQKLFKATWQELSEALALCLVHIAMLKKMKIIYEVN